MRVEVWEWELKSKVENEEGGPRRSSQQEREREREEKRREKRRAERGSIDGSMRVS